MAQNFLYSIECLVDDLLITRPNECAPDEYPTCVEISFRSNIFMSVCNDNLNGNMHNKCIKSGKSCLFALDKPINDNDKLEVSVFKKKINKCKFLIGRNSISIRPIFDRITEKFRKINSNLLMNYRKNNNSNDLNNNEEGYHNNNEKGHEDFLPTSDVTKKLLSLYNTEGKQSGNIIIFLRLSCIGPVVTSTFCLNGTKSNISEDSDDLYSLKNINSKKKSISRYSRNVSNSMILDNNSCGDRNDLDTLSCKENSDTGYPCTIEASDNNNTADEYEEFEANLNGNGITIRILKDKYAVENLDYNEYENRKVNGMYQNNYRSNYLSPICSSKIQSYNNPNVLFSNNNGMNLNKPILKQRKTRTYSLQVNDEDIDNTLLQGTNKNKSHGLEVCRRSCDDPDMDIFILKFGSKKILRGKKGVFEIELKTPKNPVSINRQKISRDTQIDEDTLDREMNHRKTNDAKANKSEKSVKQKGKGKGKGKGKKKKGKK